MCGICGWAGLKANVDIINGMMDAIHHRGPDEGGVYSWNENQVVFGHRRLSVIDLKTGKQPIHSEDGRVWIIYNGEVYNFLELREELEAKGHRFYTSSDTEVILHLYEDLGEECLHRLNGMFAFAIWDEGKKRLFLARDRLGIKPLHYVEVEGGVIFASEIKSLLMHPKVGRRLDPLSLAKYLIFEYVPSPHTIFLGIKKLPPAHILIWEKGKVSIKQYWRISFKKTQMPEGYYIERLLGLLKDSIKKTLISDVPVGAFLSGGIDSSTVVSFMKEISGGNAKTFSIGFEDPSFDESSYARRVAGWLGVEHHEEILSPKTALDLIPRIAQFLDEPLGDASIVPTYLLSRFTRERVKVSISGDGGDELFAGYPTYQAHRLAKIYEKAPSFIQRCVKGMVNRLPVSTSDISLDFKLKRFVRGIGFPQEIRNYIWLGSFTQDDLKGLLAPDLYYLIREEDPFEDLLRYVGLCDADDPLERILFLDMHLYLQDDILTKVDRASMANSLETRVPLLDHRLVEFIASIPVYLKLKGLTTKYILKKAMEGRLPKGIIYRKKKGFGIPVARWVKKELKGFILDIFDENKIKREGIFNHRYINKIIWDHLDGRLDNRKLIWTLLVFELWYERYLTS